MPSVDAVPAQTSPSTSLLDALFLLAGEQLAGAGSELPAEAEVLAAVERLRDAPPGGHWDRGLLGGLRSLRPKVVDTTARAAVERLLRLDRAEQRDSLIGAILDACFLNLSGRPRRARAEDRDETRRADAFETAAARLVEELSRFLEDRPLALEHHRSRLLAHCRNIAHLPGRGKLAEAIVAFQRALADGERSDQQAAAALFEARRSDLYSSSLTTEPTLLAYLHQDRRLAVEGAGPELFAAYRRLLVVQTKERSRRALLAAMDNLIAWLDQLPQDAAAREALLGDVQRARVQVRWADLDRRLCRHLEIHRELAAPDLGEGDLLTLLRRRWAAAESDDLLIRGLQVLRRLPLLRLRSAEICGFVLGHGRRRRSAAVWRALLELVGALLTGLSDFVLSREALGRSEQSLNRARRRLLADDGRFRALLHRLATDTSLEISNDASVAAEVRELAWRTLFRSLPENRVELLQEGLLEHQDRFFFATLEEAAASRQRELWRVVLGRWDELVAERGQPEERRRRLCAVADAFRSTSNFDAVQDGGDEEAGADRLGPMIRLALDDPDGEVRGAADAAVVAAGFALELQRERQRRELLRLRDELTETNGRIIGIEDEIGGLTHDVTEVQVARSGHSFEVQGLLGRRDLLVTDGWLTTADTQVDLEEVRAALRAALAAAAAELELLHALRRRMAGEERAVQQVHAAIRSLVGEQERLEAAIESYSRQAEQAARNAERAGRESAARQHELEGLRMPVAPVPHDDPERHQRQVAEYDNQVARYRSRVWDLRNRITALDGEENSARAALESCRRQIAEADSSHTRVGHEIRREHERIDAIRQRIDGLEREFRARQATCEEVRREIASLQAEVQRIDHRFEGERRSQRARLDGNRAEIDGEQSHLERLRSEIATLSEQLNARGHELDDQRTRGQRLVQAIDSGRENYERVAAEADERSAAADAAGASHQRATEQERREEQETLVLYAEGVERALRQPPERAHRRRATNPRS